MEYLWQKWHIPQNQTHLLSRSIQKKKPRANVLYEVWPSFCSHCSDKWPQEKLEEEEFILAHNSKLTYITIVAEIWELVTENPPGKSSENGCLHASTLCSLSTLIYFRIQMQVMRLPKMVHLPTTSSLMKTMHPKTCPQSNQSTHYFNETPFVYSSRLYLVGN